MSNPIQFWLSFEGDRIRLPVNPESISVRTNFEFTDVKVSQLGEFTVPGEANLSEITFSTFFPRDYNPTYCEYRSMPAPWQLLETLEKWRESKKPMKLTITGTPINDEVTLRNFNHEFERYGNPGDIYVEFGFKEYRHVSFERVSIQSSVESNEPVKTKKTKKRPNNRKKPEVYTVKSGDWLIKIAKKELGDASKWREIYELNKSVIGKNPDLIRPGQKLRMPS